MKPSYIGVLKCPHTNILTSILEDSSAILSPIMMSAGNHTSRQDFCLQNHLLLKHRNVLLSRIVHLIVSPTTLTNLQGLQFHLFKGCHLLSILWWLDILQVLLDQGRQLLLRLFLLLAVGTSMLLKARSLDLRL